MQNSILDDARKRAESRATILNNLSASFKGIKATATKQISAKPTFASPEIGKGESKKRKNHPPDLHGEASMSLVSNKKNKPLQDSIIHAKDNNSKSIDIVMSFVQEMGLSDGKGKKKARMENTLVTNDISLDNRIEETSESDQPLVSSTLVSTFSSIRFRNRVYEYLQEQLPSKALLLDNGSAQLDAIHRNRGQRGNNAPTFRYISNRELLSTHSVTNHKKRRKVWESAVKTTFTKHTLLEMYDQWIIYTYRAFFSKGTDEQTLQARLFHSLELVGAYVQLFRNATYQTSSYRSSDKAPHKHNDLWVNETFGYVLEVTPTCYYIASYSSSTNKESTNELSLLCVHKVSCNMVVFLPNAKIEKEARNRIHERSKLISSFNVNTDASDHENSDDIDDKDLERESDLEGDTNLPMGVVTGAPSDLSMVLDDSNDTDQILDEIGNPDIAPEQNIFIIFGMYFDSNKSNRQKLFPYPLPPPNTAL